MKPISEQIKDLENTRAAKAARMQEVMQKSIDEGRSTEADEAEEFDTIADEIKTIDQDLLRLKKLEQLNVQRAAAVDGTGTERAAASRVGATGPTIIVAPKDTAEKFKGQNYTRMVIAKALARLHECPASVIAHQRWGKSNPTLVAIMKANEVAGGGSGAGEWGAELVQANGLYTGDFVEFLYSKTVFDKLALREIPANVTIKGQDGQATGYWVGQSKAIPASAADFSAVTLTPLKVAALAVVSNELLRDSTPAAEQLVRDALVQASAQRVDSTFLSNAAASAGISPAGLLNGLTALTSAGADDAAVRADIKALRKTFIDAKNAGGWSFVMNPSLADSIGLLANALGQDAFPDISSDGGTLRKTNVVTGDNVNPSHLILLKPSDIWRIGDLGVEVSISRDAMIEQSTVPTGATDTPVAASATMTSMFQEESTAIKVVRPINFAKRRGSAVAYINNADYGDPVTP